MFKRMVFFIICLPIYLSAIIVEVDRIEDTLNYVEKDDLILLNIDIAVIESSIFLGSGPWYDFLKDKVAELQSKYPEFNSSFYYKLMLYITQKVPVIGVEETTSTFIEMLQKNHYPVLAFTGRGKDRLHSLRIPNYAKQTQNELQQANIDFSKSETPEQFNTLPESHGLTNGIFFAGEAKKGPFLKKVIEQSLYFPKKIVFVSKLDHLISVEDSMKELGVEFVGIHYTYISQNSHNFDLLAALIQLKYVLENEEVLSDEEAKLLKSEYSYLSVDDFAEELIVLFLDLLQANPHLLCVD